MTGYEALRESVAWIDEANRGKLAVSGEDRARLLHAMSTNDVQHLAAGDGLYAFFLSAQGRILADANIYNLGDILFLDTEPETAEKLRNHLDKYIIADDAAVENESAKWTTIALEGPQTPEYAARLGIPVPQKKYGIQNWRSGFVARAASTGPDGLRIFLPREDESAFREQLTTFETPHATPSEARIVRLENAIPRYGEDITERYLAQETGIQDALHFAKGCYLGQEIVERVRSRAQIHRVLRPIRIQSTTAPEPGTKLSLDGKDIAEITSAAYSPALGEVVGLAYIRTEAASSKPAMVVANSEPAVHARVA